MQHYSSLQIGSVIRGGKFTYTIQSVLGQGSFGITYLATTRTRLQGDLGNIETEVKVAVKEFFMHEFCSRHRLRAECRQEHPDQSGLQRVPI